MKRCPACLIPHDVASAAQLIAEDEILTTQRFLVSEGERQMELLGRAWLVFAFRALGYCQTCIHAKGTVIAGEVAVASLDSLPKSHAEIEAGFLGSNVLLFPMKRAFVSNAMPKKGA